MTPRTIARPTIVRTSPPLAPGAAVWAVFWALGRLSGVASPSAASAAAGAIRPQKTVATSAGRIEGIFITERSDSGQESLSTSADSLRAGAPRLSCDQPGPREADEPPRLEAQLVDDRAGEQDQRQRPAPDEGDQHEHD